MNRDQQETRIKRAGIEGNDMKKLILLVALVAARYAQAENWVVISDARHSGPQNIREVVQIDTHSILESDGYRLVWTRHNFFPAKKDPNLKDIGSLSLYEIFDCKREVATILNLVFYSLPYSSGEVTLTVDNERAVMLKKMMPAPPQSFQEMVLKQACGYPFPIKQLPK